LKIDFKFQIPARFDLRSMSGRSNFKLRLVVSLLLVCSYFLTRLFHLTIIPVFCDEAIYIRWAQVMRAVQSLRFLPLTDGKQPFFMWLVIPFLKVFSDPLVAGRLVSVTAGLGTMIGVGFLSYLLFKKKEISLFSSLLYLISPFCLFFDRMALSDGLLSMFGIWFLVFCILLIKNLRLDLAMIAGILLGFGLITKSPALFFALMLPLSGLLFDFKTGLKRGGLAKLFLNILFYWGVILVFGFTIYNILRLGPEFQMIAIRNKDYVFSLSEITKHPFNPLIGHLKDVVSWYWILGTPAVFISGILGIFLCLKKQFQTGVFLLLWWLLPLLGQGAIAKVFTARYILFTVPIFLIFAAIALEQLCRGTKRKVLVISGLVIVFLLPVYQSFLLVSAPQKAWLSKEERRGYLEMWTAGYGIMEAADYLKDVSKSEKVLVGTEGYFGTLPDGLQMYLEGVSNITIIGVGQPVVEISPKLIDGLRDNRVFLLVNDSRLKLSNMDGLKLIAKYPKTINSQGLSENLLLFEIVK